MRLQSAELASFMPVARDLALKAGARLSELLHTDLVHTRKEDRSLVTNADHAANDILREGLRRAFPSHAVLSEETGFEGPASEYVWLVDPLDGTKAFAKGVAGFSVMVGLLREERPVLGVVFDPFEKRLYEAYESGGCFHTKDGKRAVARVSDRRDWPAMPVVTSTGFPETMKDFLTTEIGSPFVEPINSVGVKVGLLVRHEADLYVNHHGVHLWDTCAPAAILAEAGGVFTHWDGSPLSYPLKGDHRHGAPTLASNNTRHADVLAVLSRLPQT